MAAGAARRGAALAFALLFAAACGGQPPAVAVVPTASPQPTVTPVPPTAVPAPRVLTVCLENEPASLYIFSAAGRGWNHVQEALRDGPIDRRSFGRQPIILERLPDWENGDVTLESVVVAAGAGLVTADGDLDRLAAGVPYWTPDMERVLARADTAVTTIQMRVTFRLREDVRWSDGAPLTADDSVFGFEIGSAAATPGSKLAAWRTASYSASDAHTITWVGQPGYYPADVLESLAEPLARHAYGNLDAAQLLTDEQANRAPLGWGAFRVAQWEPGLLRLVRNKYYFRAAEGLPRVDEVHFRTLPDESVALSAVAGGECQIAVRDSWEAWEDSADALLAAQSSGQLAVQLVPGPVLEQLGFGILMAPGMQRKAGADLFQAVALRQALAHCVDREALADAAQWGQGSAAAGFVPAGSQPASCSKACATQLIFRFPTVASCARPWPSCCARSCAPAAWICKCSPSPARIYMASSRRVCCLGASLTWRSLRGCSRASRAANCLPVPSCPARPTPAAAITPATAALRTTARAAQRALRARGRPRKQRTRRRSSC